MSSKRQQLPLAKLNDQQRRFFEATARKHQHTAARDSRRMPGHGPRGQKGR
jgi:hypothetical protein